MTTVTASRVPVRKPYTARAVRRRDREKGQRRAKWIVRIRAAGILGLTLGLFGLIALLEDARGSAECLALAEHLMISCIGPPPLDAYVTVVLLAAFGYVIAAYPANVIAFRNALVRGSFAVIVAGCAAAAPGPPTAAPEFEPTTHEALDGTEWLLVSMNGHPPPDAAPVDIEFSGRELGGYDGCNWGGGPYSISQDGAFRVESFGGTLRGCGEVANASSSEFGAALFAARYLRWTELRLEVADERESVILVFDRLDAERFDPRALVGTSWHLVLAAGMAIDLPNGLTFTTATRHEASIGCHTYEGEYSAGEDDVVFDVQTLTEGGCTDVPLTAPERRFPGIFGTAHDYWLSDDRLETMDNEHQRRVFTRQPDED